MSKKLIHAVLLLLLIPTIFACRHPIETDPGQSPEITNLQIVPEAVCGSAMVRFTLTDPNNDQIDWEAKMNTDVFGNVERYPNGFTAGPRGSGPVGEARPWEGRPDGL